MEHCDVAIIGGGMVGALAAALLAPAGLRIRVIEARAPATFESGQAFDLRVSAISAASVRLLQQAGAWDAIVAMRAWPYRALEASEWQGFGTRFEARELDCDHLGFMVENRVIQLGLWQALAQWRNVMLDCPNGLAGLTRNEDGVELALEDGQRLQARLVLACDGAESRTRQFAGIGVTAWDYAQHCMLIGIEGESLEADTTWQQFCPSGPRAFLPLGRHQGSLVWYDQKARIRELAGLDNDALAERVAAHFPARLGAFRVLDKGHFPLRRRHANQYVKGAVVLLGDAAHTINPLAGQGVNLGFKDVACLSELMHQAVEGGEEVASAALLERYQGRRRPDNLLMQGAMDLFYQTFSNDLLPFKLLRNLGLKAAHHSGPLKNRVMKYAMGL
ncbi:2-octaprenyl-3-methyl-6-methoxy-1,4-benzoquinol hydroxylase [Zobellella endophytica]|uniref:2-octaprenyl-3-methyl-6-methoxy-1,4-benzoquinol hydroxylase n=1 Tax=Zobellella endophytica TaxID=2116700 RepID=A0A2P7R3R3_9GAMM|nr:FAD-dependent monooxygenase [Zobellella endophytica]PSJ44854.1 2-octaprenyl-3-methyl-6-methoxy-1,4-benzoquinol hydroxylase [Zobellella endophytica]